MNPIPRAVSVVTVLAMLLATPGYDRVAGAEPGLSVTISDGQPASIEAPKHRVRYLARRNPIQVSNGLALDGNGNLWIDRVLRNSIWRLDVAAGDVREIAGDYEPAAGQVQSPDDMVFDEAGNLFVLEPINHTVIRIAADGTRTRLPGQITNGLTVPNGIAFRGDRLFVTEFSFDPRLTGGIWEVDPEGKDEARPILTGPLAPAGPQGFDFGPDGHAYVPEFFRGTVAVVDVDLARVERRIQVGGILSGLKVDPQGRMVVLQSDTGRVLRVDRITGAVEVLAQAQRGLDQVVIDADGTLYVSNYVLGEVLEIDLPSGDITSVLSSPGPTSAPVSLNLTEDGHLWVGDFKSVVRIDRDRSFDRVVTAFLDDVDDPNLPVLLTPSALELDGFVYFSDTFPTVDQRITRQSLATGERQVVARGFVLPTHLRRGPLETLLVCDQVAGVISLVDPTSGAVTPLVAHLQSPSGLAFDREANAVFYSESGAGRVVGVDVGTRTRIFLAEGLTTPEGVALDGRGGLLVVEGDAQRLIRIDILTGVRSVVATGLPTRAVGITAIPGFNLSADVAVRPDGEILVTGSGDGSILRLIPK